MIIGLRCCFILLISLGYGMKVKRSPRTAYTGCLMSLNSPKICRRFAGSFRELRKRVAALRKVIGVSERVLQARGGLSGIPKPFRGMVWRFREFRRCVAELWGEIGNDSFINYRWSMDVL